MQKNPPPNKRLLHSRSASGSRLIGGLLLLGSIGLAIYVVSTGKEVKTWKPFGWSCALGLLFLAVATLPPSRPWTPTYSRTSVEPLATIVNVIGGLLLLGTLAFSMFLAMNEKKEVSTWKPPVWGAVVGAVLLGIPFDPRLSH